MKTTRRISATESVLTRASRVLPRMFPQFDDILREAMLYIEANRGPDGTFVDPADTESATAVPKGLLFTSPVISTLFRSYIRAHPEAMPPSFLHTGIDPGSYVVGAVFPLYALRYSGGHYRFHPELSAALADMRDPLEMPSEVLSRLPENGFILDTRAPGRDDGALFLVSRDHYQNQDRILLSRYAPEPIRAMEQALDLLPSRPDWRDPAHVALREDFLVVAVPHLSFSIPLLAGQSVRQSIDNVLNSRTTVFASTGEVDAPERQRLLYAAAEEAMNACLYLISEKPDITSPKDRPWSPAQNPIRDTRHGPRVFVPDPRTWLVGEQIGEQIRHERNLSASHTGNRKSPRPHVRRAHWHAYRTGPRNDPDRQSYRYVFHPPIFVKPRKSPEGSPAPGG